MATVAAKIRRHRVNVVSTSRHAFPSQLKAVFPRDCFREETVPRFDETEVVELLQIHGAPAEFLTDVRIKLILGLTFGHPLLATVAAQYLRDTHWNTSKLMDLVNQQHAATIADETLNRLQITLSEAQRELLYRMSLALGAIHDDVVVQLGRVEVEIPRPRETLASLIGAWSQRESPQTSRVSPLLLGLAKPSLPESTFKGCHSVLATDILNKPLSPWDAQDAITHLIQADEPNHAGLVFQSLLERINTWEVSEELRPLLLIWQSTSLPEGMYCGLKLIIRTLQFLVLPKYGVSDRYVLEDLDLLMETLVEEDAASAYVVASFAVLFLSQRDFGRSIRYYQLAMQAIAASQFDVSEIDVLGKGHPAEFIWLPILHIESHEDLCLWQEAFDSLDSSQQRAVIGCADAILGGIILSDRLILIEAEKPDASRDWATVLNQLEEMQVWAEAKGWDYLVACILKARVNVHGEQLRKPDAILAEVKAFCDDASRACSSKSIVAGMYGRECAGVSKFDDALPWLEYASQHPVAGIGHNQLMSHLAAVLCYGSLGRFDAARDEGRLAIEFVEQDQSIDDVEAMKTYGEVAIATLKGEETKEAALAAYPIWNRAVTRMFSAERRDDNWKDNFVVFSHVHSFLVNVATTGKKAEFASDGSEYVAPYLGMFFKTAKGRLELYHDDSVPSVLWMHSVFARLAGDHAGSEEWLTKADQAIADGPITYTSAAIRGDMVPHLLIAGKYAEAIWTLKPWRGQVDTM
jgi:hypothetical protein